MKHDDGLTYFYAEHVQRLREAERRVIDAAMAWLEDRMSDREWAVIEAARALREVRGE